jgi:hypothetical protein
MDTRCECFHDTGPSQRLLGLEREGGGGRLMSLFPIHRRHEVSFAVDVLYTPIINITPQSKIINSSFVAFRYLPTHESVQ